MLHDVVHADNLLRHRGGQVSGSTVRLAQRIAQHGQRCLQAVRQKTQRLLVARLTHALLPDQCVEVAGQACQLGRVAALQLGLAAAFDPGDLRGHAAQRLQAPAQQQPLGQQQQHAGAGQPAPQRAAEGLGFAVQRGAAFQHAQDQRHAGATHPRPAHAVAGRQIGPPLALHFFKPPDTHRRAARKRQAQAQGRRRLPAGTAGALQHAGIQTRARQRQARLGQIGRHDQGALGVQLGPGQQQVHRALQARVMRGTHAVGVRPLQRHTRHRQKRHQHQGPRPDQPRADGKQGHAAVGCRVKR